MATHGEDALTKIATEAAEIFTQTYYPALEGSRSTISSYYTPTAALPDGKPIPAIVFNGNVIPSAAALQTLYEIEMPESHYEVQSFDCHVLNKNYLPQGATSGSSRSGKNISILVLVSGFVRYGESREEPIKAFSETVILVPNLDKGDRRARDRKDWLIQSQTFRLVT